MQDGVSPLLCVALSAQQYRIHNLDTLPWPTFLYCVYPRCHYTLRFCCCFNNPAALQPRPLLLVLLLVLPPRLLVTSIFACCNCYVGNAALLFRVAGAAAFTALLLLLVCIPSSHLEECCPPSAPAYQADAGRLHGCMWGLQQSPDTESWQLPGKSQDRYAYLATSPYKRNRCGLQHKEHISTDSRKGTRLLMCACNFSPCALYARSGGHVRPFLMTVQRKASPL